LYLDFNIDAIRAAEAELQRLAKAASMAAFDAPSSVTERSPRAQDHGRVAEAAANAQHALENVKIIVDVYGGEDS
jgi:hypothetical protein